MALKITSKETNSVVVVSLEGRIVLGEESNALREKIKSLLYAGKKKVVLNMSKVDYIDAAGLGTLSVAFHSARGQGCTLKLCSLHKQHHESIVVAKITLTFETFDTEEAAVESFNK